MPDSEEFQVAIKTPLDDSGIKKAGEGFEKLGDSAKDAGKAVGETGEHGEEAGKKISKGAEESTLKHHELKEAVRAVSQQFGGLADVGLWLSPLTAALAAVLFIVDKLKEHFSELTQRAIEAAAKMREINSERIEALSNAARNAAANIAAMVRALAGIADGEKDGDKAMQQRIELLGEEAEAVKKVAQAREKSYEADVDQQVDQGKITKEEGEKRKNIARGSLEDFENSTNKRKEELVIGEHQRQLDEARGRLKDGEQKQYEAAEHAAEPEEAKKEQIDKRIPKLQAELDAKNKDLDSERGFLKNLKTPGTWENIRAEIGDLGGLFGHPTQNTQEHATKGRIAELEKATSDLQTAIDRLKDMSQAHDEAAKDAHAHAEDIGKQLTKDTALDKTGDAQIAHEKALAKIHADTAESVSDANVETDLRKEGQEAAPPPARGPRQISAQEVQARLQAAGYGGPQQDTFALNARNAISEANAAIAHADSAHGQNGTLAVLAGC